MTTRFPGQVAFKVLEEHCKRQQITLARLFKGLLTWTMHILIFVCRFSRLLLGVAIASR
jgi:hypothetical protein